MHNTRFSVLRIFKITILICIIFILYRTYFVYNAYFSRFENQTLININLCKNKPLLKLHHLNKDYSYETDIFNRIFNGISSFTSNTILITFVNNGYVNLAKNWLCNTLNMDIHDKVLMITTNEHIRSELSALSSQLTVISISVKEELSKHLSYSHVGYIRLLILRTKVLNSLLIRDFEVFLFECDFLWLKNPLHFFTSKKGKHDLVVIPDTRDNTVINGGFFFLFPTNKTKALFATLTEKMDNLGKTIHHLNSDKPVPENQNDQVYLTALLKTRYAGINCLRTSFEDFPSGLWYNTPETVRNSWKPFVIHNNWIIGNIRKEERAKKWHHWFLSDEFHCNSSLLNELLMKYSMISQN